MSLDVNGEVKAFRVEKLGIVRSTTNETGCGKLIDVLARVVAYAMVRSSAMRISDQHLRRKSKIATQRTVAV